MERDAASLGRHLCADRRASRYAPSHGRPAERTGVMTRRAADQSDRPPSDAVGRSTYVTPQNPAGESIVGRRTAAARLPGPQPTLYFSARYDRTSRNAPTQSSIQPSQRHYRSLSSEPTQSSTSPARHQHGSAPGNTTISTGQSQLTDSHQH